MFQTFFLKFIFNKIILKSTDGLRSFSALQGFSASVATCDQTWNLRWSIGDDCSAIVMMILCRRENSHYYYIIIIHTSDEARRDSRRQ